MASSLKILNIRFNAWSYNDIVSYLQNNENRKGYICFPDIYNIIRANHDYRLLKIYNESTLTLPDGTPSKWLLKKKGVKNATTISGFWLCRKLLDTNLSHYFYGTTPVNLQLMEKRINQDFPKANIFGFKSPPVIDEDKITNNLKLDEEIGSIISLKPDIIWIGISSPKQDLLMYNYQSKAEGTILIGVGAVFDYFAGTAYMGPEWAKKIGLRWLFQLIYDPKRYISRILYIFIKLPILILKKNKIVT
jgi:N-acetylglucosaminyldiphosphoundecaprenol N-acetyl-beta-D-mannosaminyltransferase